ncbi:acyl-CoA dehydrogenase family protein [Jatrophihabitans sp.]|uniref:acyl-CoA dehydrogenase family protein n=1 Tax=Jatrophihabitans sp. TaxID=1932789 RepID=UPI0030C706CB|nr:acyl-CoA dehydrogenase protein [Jatrophihabitans sp.]
MSWDFETDPEFQRELDWISDFVREEIVLVDEILGSPADMRSPLRQRLIPPLQARVKERGLWALHLGPEHGGRGYGQVKLALINEILGATRCGPFIFGCQAPDSGNAELLARFGTDAQKKEYLQPLIDGDICSTFSMTEPAGGADPTSITACAELRGDRWVLSGEKWFASNARFAEFIIAVVVTDPDAAPRNRSSMFLIPREHPGLEIVRNVASVGQPQGDGSHGYLRFVDLELGPERMLGERGQAFAMAQARLGGGRIHHAMRTVGAARRAFDMLCERALSRHTQGSPLAHKQLVQQAIAESWLSLEQFRLLVLRTAWLIDTRGNYESVRGDIAAVKAAMPRVLHDLAGRALQLHGSIGVSDEMPFSRLIIESYQMGLVDGPTEVHQMTLARQVLKNYEASDSLFPAYHLPTLKALALARYGDALAESPPEEPWA